MREASSEDAKDAIAAWEHANPDEVAILQRIADSYE
jgi:hypothetical protein